ncbi:aroma-sacti cluster domain-containing protein [Nonomuraea sp. CA-141351]|uniref:aroma-sacti cluster domain-containing protein n=1 Tax=Nonomuraea sp. CA-141351 TaxID=3239996 RepID=UPI003D8FBB91
MAFDPVRELAEAGLDLQAISEEQRAIVAGLSPAEVAMLISINERLLDTEPEVEAHIIGGLLF